MSWLVMFLMLASGFFSGAKIERVREARRQKRIAAEHGSDSATGRVKVGERWRFMGKESTVARVYPGGGGGLGIVEFEDDIPTSHASTMLNFRNAWKRVS